jgi:hypothetical protein
VRVKRFSDSVGDILRRVRVDDEEFHFEGELKGNSCGDSERSRERLSEERV